MFFYVKVQKKMGLTGLKAKHIIAAPRAVQCNASQESHIGVGLVPAMCCRFPNNAHSK